MSHRLQLLIIVFIAVILAALLIIPGNLGNERTGSRTDQQSEEITFSDEADSEVPVSDVLNSFVNDFDADELSANDLGLDLETFEQELEAETGDFAQPINVDEL